jgi:hypothetical protein
LKKLINCERNLKSERTTNESEKSNATRIATMTIMLTIICSIKYCAIVVASLTYLIRITMKNFFISSHKMLEIMRSSLLT